MIRNQTVESPKVADNGLDQPIGVLWRGKLRLNGACVGSAVRNYAVSSDLRFLIIESDLCTGGTEHAHSCCANSARSTGNKSNFPGKRELYSILGTRHGLQERDDFNFDQSVFRQARDFYG